MCKFVSRICKINVREGEEIGRDRHKTKTHTLNSCRIPINLSQETDQIKLIVYLPGPMVVVWRSRGQWAGLIYHVIKSSPNFCVCQRYFSLPCSLRNPVHLYNGRTCSLLKSQLSTAVHHGAKHSQTSRPYILINSCDEYLESCTISY